MVPFFLPEDSSLAAAEHQALAAVRDRHANESCFIVCNGPSLKTMPLPLLERRWFIGVNRGYFAYDLGLPRCRYFVFTDQEL